MSAKDSDTNQAVQCFMALMIIMVVAGHVPGSGLSGPFGLFPLYSFHVAAFCFASGYLYSERHDREVVHYLIARFKRLLIPMYLLYVLYGFIRQFLEIFLGVSFGAALSVESIVLMPITNGAQFGLNYAMWYIAPFFAAQCIWVVIRGMLVDICFNVDYSSIILSVIMGMASVWFSGKEGLEPGLSLFICRASFLLSWLAIGRLYRVRLLALENIDSTAYLISICAMQMMLWYMCGGSPSYTPGWCSYPNGIILTYAATAIGIGFWWRVCRVVSTRVSGRANKMIKIVGSNTFSIMCHHLMGFFFLKVLFYCASRVSPLFGLFDSNLFLSNVDYFYYPHNITQFSFLYTVFGILFSLAVHQLWVHIKSCLSCSAVLLGKNGASSLFRFFSSK